MIKILFTIIQILIAQITFRDIPYSYMSQNNHFSELRDYAHEDIVRILVLGDSQETCPGGAGIYYIPRMNYEFYLRTGNVPETPIGNVGSYTGEWLLRGAAASPGIIPSRLTSQQKTPNLGGASTYSLGPVQNYGQLLMLQHNAYDVNSQTNVNGIYNYFNTQSVYLEVFGATNPISGEIHIDVKPTNTNVTNYFKPIVQSYNSSIGLESPNYDIKSFFVGPLNFNNLPYMQVEISGTSSTKPTDIIGARFISSNPIGYSISSFSMGGYTSWHIQNNHNQSGKIINAFNPDIVWITYGANDAAAGNGLTPQEFKSNILWLINYIRESTNKPELSIILIPDSYAITMVGQKYTYWERYVPACVEIADGLDNIMVINSCRYMYEHGLNESTYSNYLSDGVHYNSYGASIKAECEINILYDIQLSCEYDLNSDGNLDQDDIFVLINAIAGDNPELINTDINNDGNTDQDDIIFLINIIGSGGC